MKIMGMDASAVFVLVLLLLIAIVPARIAKKKGYSYAGFYVFGIFVWPAALIFALCIKDRANEAAAEGANALKAYKELLDSGAITQEEFDAKKAEILRGDKA